MNCHYHVSATMQPLTEKTPAFVEQDVNVTERTTLYCPVAGCPFVAQANDSERVNMRFCNVCGARITGTECLTDYRCQPCRNSKLHVKDRKARLGMKWRGPMGKIKHAR